MSKETPGVRYAEITRETSETRVEIVLDLDGGSRRDITTGLGFFDHMLMQFAFHGMMDIGLRAEGDLYIDDHHTIEDVGIVLGQAIRIALESSEPLVRYASIHVPMDEALVLCAIDVSGRGSLHFNVPFKRPMIGEVATECFSEFFRAIALHSGLTIHIHLLAGENDHHIAEAVFKAFGVAFHAATRRGERRAGTSTKGSRDR